MLLIHSVSNKNKFPLNFVLYRKFLFWFIVKLSDYINFQIKFGLIWEINPDKNNVYVLNTYVTLIKETTQIC